MRRHRFDAASLVFGLLFGVTGIAFLGGQTLGETDPALLWIAPTLVLGLAVLLVGIGRLRAERPTPDEGSDLIDVDTEPDPAAGGPRTQTPTPPAANH